MKKKIYIADDEELVAQFFRGYLADKGFQVKTQTRSEKVLEEIAAFSPDLVFLDYQMRPFTGVDILERLKAMGLQTPIVMMSAYKRREGVFEMKRLGAFEYIGKPFDLTEVDRILGRLNECEAKEAIS
jgi:DNA-binding response OmpR family regulator